MIVVLLGGSRSGKSALAERRAESASGGGPVTYLATATVDEADVDFGERVARHRDRRPTHWTTVETGASAGPDLAEAVRAADGVVLLDSLGTWVAGHHDLDTGDFEVDVDELVAALVTRDDLTIVVAEEVGLGVHPETAVGRRFRDALGTVNQAVIDVADEAWFVAGGRVTALDRCPW